MTTVVCSLVFFFHDTGTPESYTLSLHAALPTSGLQQQAPVPQGLTYGARGTVLGRDEAGRVHLRTEAGHVVQLPLSESEKFSVYERTEVQLATGDLIRITQNMNSKPRTRNADPHRLSNGSLYRVAGFTRSGDLRLENGWVIDKEAGFVAPGYVSTSYGSQGKTREYAHRCEMDYDGERIEMFYSTGVKVTVVGNHLLALYNDLAAHRVVWIESRETLHALKQLRSDVTGHELPVVLDVIVERGRLDADTGTWQPASGRWNAQRQVWEPAHLLN